MAFPTVVGPEEAVLIRPPAAVIEILPPVKLEVEERFNQPLVIEILPPDMDIEPMVSSLFTNAKLPLLRVTVAELEIWSLIALP